MATDHDRRERPDNKPQFTDADKALLEAEPDWSRMGQGARRLLEAKPEKRGAEKVSTLKR